MTELDVMLSEYDAGLTREFSLPWGDYRIVSRLRVSEHKQVLLVADPAGDRFILKVAEGSRRLMLEREYRALRRLKHSGFPTAVAFKRQDNRAFFLCEYIPGKTLEAYASERQLSVNEILHWGREVCELIGVLHGQEPPIIHRDIKPQNFVVTPDQRLVLVDFDSVQAHDLGKRWDTLFIGTLNTAAPEQFGAARSGFSTDVYGIGKLIAYLITNDADTERLNAARTPNWLRRVIRRATAFDPNRRYPSVEKLKNALIRGQRRPMKIAVSCCVLALLCCCTAALLPAILRAQNETEPIAGGKPVVFAEPLIEKAAAYQLGKEPGTITLGDLRSVTKILICGDILFDEWDQVSCFGKDSVVLRSSGETVANNGGIVSLEDLRMMPNLRELALYLQSIEDIGPLNGLPLKKLALSENSLSNFSSLASLAGLTCLDVSATKFADVSVLANCRRLEKLHITDTQVYDLSPLVGLPILELRLRYDNISDDISILDRFPELISLRVDAPASALETIGKLTALTNLDLTPYRETSLLPLENLVNLRQLCAGVGDLESLEGVQSLTHLEILQIDKTLIRDLSPIFDLALLHTMSMSYVPLDDESQLLRLAPLKWLGVAADQVEHFQALNADFQVYATTY